MRSCWAIGQGLPTTARNVLITVNDFLQGCQDSQRLKHLSGRRNGGQGPCLAWRVEDLKNFTTACLSLCGSVHEDGASLVTVVLGRRIPDNSKMWS